MAYRLFGYVLLASVFACHTNGADTVTLKVSSTTELTELEFDIRDVDYDWVPAQYYDLGARDITKQPLSVLLEPSLVIKDRFFVRVKGFAHGAYVAMDSNILSFKSDQALTTALRLKTGFTDADDDGFAQCAVGPLCDCNDHNDHINPFTRENCDDDLDNDCSGVPLKLGCPCQAGVPLACTTLPESLASSAGIGACYFGALQCVDGKLDTVCHAGTLSSEIPNNYIDDDCDGSVDEGSACNQGQSRPCHLGFVDDANNPNPAERQGASKRALGVCGDPTHKPFGVQACTQDINGSWIWGGCVGDVLPQRNTRPGQTGWAEIPSDPTSHTLGQCDGLDNDCDGLVDDASEYDSDRDGYKICGTDSRPNATPPLNPELVDCDDSNPKINPGATEICGNAIDEDCRCDHDPNGLPATDSNSLIGQPSVGVDGTQICPALDEYLRCNALPRSDSHPVGFCKDGPDAYYVGIYGPNQDCYACPLLYGLSCDVSTGSCSQKAADCSACVGSAFGDISNMGAARPQCKVAVVGSCHGTTGPAWTDLTNTDPFNDCGAVSCSGYYDRIQNGRCFGKSDVSAAAVVCKAGGQCQVNADVCPQSTAAANPVPQPICTQISSGCVGTKAPSFVNQPPGQDTFAECNSAYICSDVEIDGGGPFYFGIVGNVCYFRANVGNNNCNGAGSCQSRIEACGVAGQGGVVPGRPLCTQTAGGCNGTTGPVYSAVVRGQDPFSECGGRGCDGSGHCLIGQGGSCSSDAACSTGHCVDGVCCNTACAGTCQACATTLTGAANGTCAYLSQNATDAPTCSGSSGCAGNNCTCVANTGVCKDGLAGSCAVDADCVSGFCDCVDAACSTRACDSTRCGCAYDSNSDGICDGALASGVNDPSVCTSGMACNGAGACKPVSGSCVNDTDCAGTCINLACATKSALGGPCDAGDNADCSAGTCKGGICN